MSLLAALGLVMVGVVIGVVGVLALLAWAGARLLANV